MRFTLLLILAACSNNARAGEITGDSVQEGYYRIQRRKQRRRAREGGGEPSDERGLKDHSNYEYYYSNQGMGMSKSSSRSIKGDKGEPPKYPYPPYSDDDEDDSGGDGGDGGGSTGESDDSGDPPVGDCSSYIAKQIQTIPEVFTRNPRRCCGFVGPTMVLVTHAQPDSSTITGFEPFWNTQYLEVASLSEMSEICFVMTGYNPDTDSEKSLNDVLLEVNELVSTITTVTSMMSTDPTEELDLVNLFRQISNSADKPSIGVFNAGISNIETEALVSGQEKLPYVGYSDDAQYGSEAAFITNRLLKGEAATPLCFNGRPQLSYVGRRCAAYYTDVTETPPSRLFGISCRADSNVNAILALILETEANAIYSQIDCCQPVALAVERARELVNHTIVAGCQDEDPSGGIFDFVTGQPIALQAYQTASWGTLPVLQSLEGLNGRAGEFFPSLTSLLETDIFTSLVF